MINLKFNAVIYRLLQVCLVLLGMLWLQSSSSSPALAWMNIYVLEDFANYTWADIGVFLLQNKLPLPPVIVFFELATYKLFGSTYLVTVLLYKFAFIAPYVIVLSFAKTSMRRVWVVFFISCLFLFCAITIHRGNPQGYDVFLPCLLVLFLYCAQSGGVAASQASKLKYAVLAGVCLSLAELTRPFMIYLVPLLIILMLLGYRGQDKTVRSKLMLGFLMPIILISGSLHLSLYINHQQLNFSNHAGFNLHRAWSRLVPVPALLEEPKLFQANPERWENFNTKEHQLNSQRMQDAIFKHWLTQPVQSLSFGINLLRDFMSAPTAIYEHKPTSIFLQSYQLLYQVLSGVMLLNCVIVLGGVGFLSKNKVQDLMTTDNLIILLGTSLLVIFAISEKAEEARFVISTLPFVAACALARINSRVAEPDNPQTITVTW
jgi:4-amino-4-deoxy-L-arabinose transferase-like glycosyltransferase